MIGLLLLMMIMIDIVHKVGSIHCLPKGQGSGDKRIKSSTHLRYSQQILGLSAREKGKTVNDGFLSEL